MHPAIDSILQEALRIKSDANKLFVASKYTDCLQLYTLSLNKNPFDPAVWCNRTLGEANASIALLPPWTLSLTLSSWSPLLDRCRDEAEVGRARSCHCGRHQGHRTGPQIRQGLLPQGCRSALHHEAKGRARRLEESRSHGAQERASKGTARQHAEARAAARV